jgi:hypothetical protein
MKHAGRGRRAGAGAVWLLALCVPCLLVAATAQAPATNSRRAATKSDRRVYPEPPLPALPRAGGTFVDPTFGTEIMRVTDERDGKSCGTYYPYWPTLNADSTRLLVRRAQAGDAIYEFDPVNFKLGKSYVVPRLPDGGAFITEGATWSATDPDTLYGGTFSGPRLLAFDAAARTYKVVRDFSREEGFSPRDYLWQMSMSEDSDTFAFTHRNSSYQVVGYLVYRRSTDRVLLNVRSTIEDEVQLDKTGRYLQLPLAEADKSGKSYYIQDLQAGTKTGLTPGAPDYAPAHGDVGAGMMVAWDNDDNRLLWRDLSNPHVIKSVLDLGSDWSQGLHLSLRGRTDDWALVSFISTAEVGAGLFHKEIVLVKTDGSQQVRRLLHHRSIYRDYWDAPRGNLSYDGRFAAFSSNWGGKDRVDLFIARLDPPLPSTRRAHEPPARTVPAARSNTRPRRIIPD